MKIKKITLKKNASNYHRKKKPYIGQQTVDQCFSAQTVAWADLYPFAVCLLSVCCPKYFALYYVLLGYVYTVWRLNIVKRPGWPIPSLN